MPTRYFGSTHYLVLNNLRSAEGLKLPKIINYSLDLSSLESVDGLRLPETINGNLDLRSLESAEGLKLPEIINGSLYLSSLESLDGIIFPENFQFKIIYLAKNVKVTPENVHEYIDKPKSK